MIQRTIDLTAFKAAYPKVHAKFRFAFDGLPFQDKEILALAQTMSSKFTYYRSGDYPVAIDVATMKASEKSIYETIKSINAINSWMMLRKIDDHAKYAESIIPRLHDIFSIIDPKTAPLTGREVNLILASAKAVTPLSIDVTHNIYFQVKGVSKVTVMAAHNEYMPPQTEVEKLLSGPHRNLEWCSIYAEMGSPVTLNPGEAVYIPAFSPFWVNVGDEAPSLNLHLQWHTRASDRIASLHRINHQARLYGKEPAFPGSKPVSDQAKILVRKITQYARDAEIEAYNA